MSIITTTHCGGRYGTDIVVSYGIVDSRYSITATATSARATIDDIIYLEEAGNPVEICEKNIAIQLNRVDNAANALADLADQLIRVKRCKLGRWINNMLVNHACAAIVAHFDCQRALDRCAQNK